MSSQTKKFAILHRLRQESDPISVQELIQKLGGNYAARSVRRWLAELIREGFIDRLGNKRSSRYAISQQKTISTAPFRPESKKLLRQVQSPIYERAPITYADSWLEAYQPNVSFYIPLEQRRLLHEAGKRSQLASPAGSYAHQIFNRLLIDLSYNSSRLEGNTYSLLDTQKLLLEGASAEGKLDEETIMILNHKEAIRYLVDTAPRLEVSSETVCTLHYLLSDGLVEANHSGKVRRHGVRVGGSSYIPFEDPKQLQTRLERVTKMAACIQNPYEQSLFLLVHISYLQAFADVNKRTARLSANISLIKNNLVPLSFNDVERLDYSSAMIVVYELQDIRPILDLYLFSYMRTCSLYDSTLKTLGVDELRVRYRTQRRAVIHAIIANGLVHEFLHRYLESQASSLVKQEDRNAFVEDALEDLREIDQGRIAGLGLTPEQLQSWLLLRDWEVLP